MMNHTNTVNFGVGSLAFLAGVLATLVTAYAVSTKKTRVLPNYNSNQYNHYDGWDEGLGV
jgi:hypothetical protein